MAVARSASLERLAAGLFAEDAVMDGAEAAMACEGPAQAWRPSLIVLPGDDKVPFTRQVSEGSTVASLSLDQGCMAMEVDQLPTSALIAVGRDGIAHLGLDKLACDGEELFDEIGTDDELIGIEADGVAHYIVCNDVVVP
mmetsp:Transcript_97682/g.276349  ORF Transcript_97682/g.276349 Transcript_97682/m.276349 type:complete len:140 (+) Transcript_97682:85-504(+)